jgi:hypothetical protein
MDLNKTMVCPKCGNVVAVTDQFCSKCYERLERPSFWRRLSAWFRSALKPGMHTMVIRKNANFETIDPQNARHVYHSLDEMPPDVRGKFEKLESEMKKDMEAVQLPSDISKDLPQPGHIVRKTTQVFKIKDAKGKEQVYHSLDEMPPETRALFEKIRGRIGGLGS